MNEWIMIAGVLLLLSIVAGGVYSLERIRRRNALLRWAASHGYKIIGYRQPMLTEMSPFPTIGSKAQQIFHFTVELPDGTHKSGWVLLGRAWGGLNSEQAEIRWDA